jgi:hypothetical protein
MKPATPLPFRIDHNSMLASGPHAFTSLMWSDDPTDGLSREQVEQNFLYIAHACNAYPKLVEALRWYRDETKALANQGRTSHHNAKRASELLAELGEK